MKTSHDSYSVKGYLANGVRAGIKENDAKDLALIFSMNPAKASGVFTKNAFKAAPVLLDQERIKTGVAQAIFINSGNANAATGEAGYQDALNMSRLLSYKLNIPDDLILVASTGVIGHRLPMEKISKGVISLVEGLNSNGIPDAGLAIMTTDQYPKISRRNGSIYHKEVSICGIAKGAGMIQPQMATMLAFIVTDIDIENPVLDRVFKEVTDVTFNAITVDGCMSTNDTAIILANGASRNKTLKSGSSAISIFREMLFDVMIELAKAIVRDGEGATKIMEIIVEEAMTTIDAKRVAYAVANSNLVKTAIFGNDPNWGRILAAVGSVDVALNVDRVKLYIEDILVFFEGRGIRGNEKELSSIMESSKNLRIKIILGMGKRRYRVYSSDLTYDYIKINAHYRT